MPDVRTSTFLIATLLLLLSTSIGCGPNQSVTGDPDSFADTSPDIHEDVPICLSNADCDDSDPCTEDICDAGACVRSTVDSDEDGYPAAEVDGIICEGTDCDDTDALIYPDAEERPCNGRDDDCDGVMSTVEDFDVDGYPNEDCAPVGADVDCDDDDDSVYPGAHLQCDGLDHDCSGNPDRDEDGDGHYNEDICDGGDDCDDSREDVFTGAPEVCLDDIDQDCDGEVDERLNALDEIRITYADGDSTLPNMAWTGSEYGIAWLDDRNDEIELFFVRLSPLGEKVAEDYLVSRANWVTTPRYPPCISWTGSEFGLLWYLWHVDGISRKDLAFQRVSPDGSLIASSVILTTHEEPDAVGPPSMSWSGSNYGIVYNLITEMVYLQIDPLGAMNEYAHIRSPSGFSPAIAWNGTGYGVAFHALGVFLGTFELDGSNFIEDYVNMGVYPDLAWTGSEYIVSSRRYYTDWPVGWIELYWYDPDTPFTPIDNITISDFSAVDSSIALAGSDFGVAYTEYYLSAISVSTVTDDVVAGNHVLSGHALIAQDTGSSQEPRLNWSGTEFGLTWSDQRDGNSEIYFSRIQYCY